MNINSYAKYVYSNTESIVKLINNNFEKSKEFIKTKLINTLREFLDPIPKHYDWKVDNNPFDYSGVIVENGIIDLNQTILNFLNEEYTGNKVATYLSGMGWHYETYEDELQYTTMEIASNIMLTTIKDCIETEFSVKLSENEFEEIRDACLDFDDIYSDCKANDFFFSISAIQFVGIENIKLIDIIKEKG